MVIPYIYLTCWHMKSTFYERQHLATVIISIATTSKPKNIRAKVKPVSSERGRTRLRLRPIHIQVFILYVPRQ
jgi:hypothetical protein